MREDSVDTPSVWLSGCGHWKPAFLLLCCLLIAVVPGRAQEPGTQQPVTQQTTDTGTVQQPAGTAAAPNDTYTPGAANTLTLAFAYSLLILTVMFAVACIASIWSSREWPEIESHWGGLGGGLGGVRISPSLLFLVAAIAFAGLLSGVHDDLVRALSVDSQEQTQSQPVNPANGQQEREADSPADEQPQQAAAGTETPTTDVAPPAEDGE